MIINFVNATVIINYIYNEFFCNEINIVFMSAFSRVIAKYRINIVTLSNIVSNCYAINYIKFSAVRN